MPKNMPDKPLKPLYPPKDYKKWSKLKSQINNNITKPHAYSEGHIYWVNLGENIGREEDGKNNAFSRPAIIVSGFSQDFVWIVPLSHTKRKGKYYYHFLFDNKHSNALLSQLRSIDTARISSQSLGQISRKDFRQICTKLQSFLEVKYDATL